MRPGLRPVNSTAARVVASGTAYVPNKTPNCEQFAARPPMRAITLYDRNSDGFQDVTGVKRGRLVVVGLYDAVGVKWLARCGCGTYVLRKTRSMANQTNDADACAECLHVMYVKRHELFRRTGKDCFLRDFV